MYIFVMTDFLLELSGHLDREPGALSIYNPCYFKKTTLTLQPEFFLTREQRGPLSPSLSRITMSSWSQCARFTAYPLDTGNNGRRLQSNTVFSSIASRTRSKCRNMRISMRDRSKNRKPLQKGRNLSIEAIQAVQALKRAKQNGESALEQVFNSKITRLLKNDLIAVLRELIRQNQCLLALKVSRFNDSIHKFFVFEFLFLQCCNCGSLEFAFPSSKLPTQRTKKSPNCYVHCSSHLPPSI